MTKGDRILGLRLPPVVDRALAVAARQDAIAPSTFAKQQIIKALRERGLLEAA